MRLLLDTHAYLWWLTDDRRLGKAARAAIGSPASIVHVSAASIWEIGIKAALGRLPIGQLDVVEAIAECGFDALPITPAHAQAAARLPRLHDDPFDRMLVAQSRVEDLRLVTRDAGLMTYGVEALW